MIKNANNVRLIVGPHRRPALDADATMAIIVWTQAILTRRAYHIRPSLKI